MQQQCHGLVLPSISTSTDALFTPKLGTNKHPPLSTLPHPISPSTSSANSSTSQKPCTSLYVGILPNGFVQSTARALYGGVFLNLQQYMG